MPRVVKNNSTRPPKVQREVATATRIKETASENKVRMILVPQGIVPLFFLSRIGHGEGFEYYLPLLGLAASVFYMMSDGWHLFFNRGLACISGGIFWVLFALLLSKPFELSYFTIL